MNKPLDEDTFQRVTMVIDRARRSGVNVPTRLNDAQLLWTKEREHRAMVEAVRNLIEQFQVWMPHEFLRTINRDMVGYTPTQMHTAIAKWLDKYLIHVRDDTSLRPQSTPDTTDPI